MASFQTIPIVRFIDFANLHRQFYFFQNKKENALVLLSKQYQSVDIVRFLVPNQVAGFLAG
ncbi:hypothetical protein J5TS2_18480 [Brevibacillus halotolerans]|nr:hypothetical protein J5TS2_18480 [Brevibacillus halotolerans]